MKKQHVTLREEDRMYLKNLISKGELPVKIYKRSLALLELDRGKTFTCVAKTVGVSIPTVSTWAQNYKNHGLSCLQVRCSRLKYWFLLKNGHVNKSKSIGNFLFKKPGKS